MGLLQDLKARHVRSEHRPFRLLGDLNKGLLEKLNADLGNLNIDLLEDLNIGHLGT